MRNRARQPAGFIELDAIFGIAIVGILLMTLGRSVMSQREADQRMADQRAAVALAERTLTALQLGAPMPEAGGHGRAVVRLIEGKAIGEHPWVEVTAHFRATSATISGIARRAAAEKASGEVIP